MRPTFDLTFETANATYGLELETDYQPRTYIISNDGWEVYEDTSDTQLWAAFYKLGWSKAELHQGFKEEWRDAINQKIAEYQNQ